MEYRKNFAWLFLLLLPFLIAASPSTPSPRPKLAPEARKRLHAEVARIRALKASFAPERIAKTCQGSPSTAYFRCFFKRARRTVLAEPLSLTGYALLYAEGSRILTQDGASARKFYKRRHAELAHSLELKRLSTLDWSESISEWMLTGHYRAVDESRERVPRAAFLAQLMIQSDELLGDLKKNKDGLGRRGSLERHTLELFVRRQERLRRMIP